MSDTTLTLSDDQREALAGMGIPQAEIEHALQKSIADGKTQDELDTDIAAAIESHQQALAANEKAREEQAAEQRKANRAAFAGMALQGILANPTWYGVVPRISAQTALQHADALLAALDAETSDEE